MRPTSLSSELLSECVSLVSTLAASKVYTLFVVLVKCGCDKVSLLLCVNDVIVVMLYGKLYVSRDLYVPKPVVSSPYSVLFVFTYL